MHDVTPLVVGHYSCGHPVMCMCTYEAQHEEHQEGKINHPHPCYDCAKEGHERGVIVTQGKLKNPQAVDDERI